MKRLGLLLICCCAFAALPGQTSDDRYRMPLDTVLRLVEERFRVQLKYPGHLVAGRTLDYAQWRFREDVQSTLEKILAPFDLTAIEERAGAFEIKAYEYHRWPVAEGWKRLDHLASRYRDLGQWEDRKRRLRDELWVALRLSPLPTGPGSPPIITPERRKNGYTVRNVALEILPGVFVSGSLYRPAEATGDLPVVLCPDGHWSGHRYREDAQLRCGMIARLGAIAFSYDLFAWGESLLQFQEEDHRRSLAQTMQILAGIRILDYLLNLDGVDATRVGISGGSGGGSHATLMTALDDRITLTAPVVSLSSYHFGGCPCESGMPIHFCGGGTNNVEIAAMAAPRPQLVVSDGKDWTAHMPQKDFPFLQTIYRYFGEEGRVVNVHLPNEGHDYGISKRKALYEFLITHFNLDSSRLKYFNGEPDESAVDVEAEEALYAFGAEGQHLPRHAIKGFEALEAVFAGATAIDNQKNKQR